MLVVTPAAEHYCFKLDFQNRAVVLVTVPSLPPVRLERFLKKLRIGFGFGFGCLLEQPHRAIFPRTAWLET